MGSLGAALASEPTAAARLEELARGAQVEGWSGEALVKRLRHFSREDARVAEAVAAFHNGDEARLKNAAEASQAESKNLLDNQVDETVIAGAVGVGKRGLRSTQLRRRVWRQCVGDRQR